MFHEELKHRLALAEKKVTDDARRRHFATDMSNDDKENVLKERDDFHDENVQLKKYVGLLKKKLSKETTTAAENVAELTRQLEEVTHKLEDTKRKLDDEHSTNYFMREDLTKSKVAVTSLQRQMEALKASLDTSKMEQLNQAELDRLYTLLSSELSRCLSDLQSLSAVTKQLMEGADPNVSMLLGIRDDSSRLTDESGLNVDISEGKLERLKKQLGEVKEVRANIMSVRDELSEKYAEKLGDNMTSCVTQ